MSTPVANVSYVFNTPTHTWQAPGRPSFVGTFGLMPSALLTPSATLKPSGG